MNLPDKPADATTRLFSLRRVVRGAIGLIPVATRSVGRTGRTLGRIAAAVWTRRLPPDEELISASWQLALLGCGTLALLPLIHWFHNYLDPPPNAGVWTGAGRFQNYGNVTFVLFSVFNLVSMSSGMWVSRRRPRVLWWVAPQMVVLVNVIGMVNLYLTVETLKSVRIFLTNDVQLFFLFMPLVGAFAVTAAWMWWVLTPSDMELLAKELGAEQAAREKAEAAGRSELEGQP